MEGRLVEEPLGSGDHEEKEADHGKRLPRVAAPEVVERESQKNDRDREPGDETRAPSQAEEVKRTLFETMAQGVIYQNAKGKIIFANPAAERILGLNVDQMKTRDSVDFLWKAIHEDGRDFTRESHPAFTALKTGKKVSVLGFGGMRFDSRTISKNPSVPSFEPLRKV